MPQVAQATILVTPVLEGAQSSLTEQLTGAATPAGLSAGMAAGKSIGSQIGSFAVKTVAALGVGKMIGDSISRGMDFETSMAKASTLFTGTKEELAALQDQILGISSATGMMASTIAEAAYSAESASIPAGNLGSMLESSAKLAIAGYTDVDTALSATAKTMNAYGMVTDDVAETQANMEKVQKILIQTQNKGITTVGELGQSLAQVTPTAAAFNVGFEQIGAALAGMTAQGTPTAQATTQLNAMIAELGKEGTTASTHFRELTGYLKEGGLTFAEAMEQGWDLTDVLSILEEEANASGVSLVDMFSSIEAGKGALSIWNSDWNENMGAMATEADVVTEAYDTMADTVSFKLDQMKSTFQNMGIEAFSAVSDDLLGILEGAQGILEDISPALETLGSAFLDAGRDAVDAVADMLGIEDGLSTAEKLSEILTTAIEGLADVFTFLGDNADTIIPIITTLGGALLIMKSPLGDIAKGLGGLIGNLGGLGGAASTVAGPVASAGASFAGMAGQALMLVAAAGALWIAAQAISVLVDAAIRITEAGWPAIAVLGGMVVAIGGLMAVASLVGPGLTAGAVGIIAFGAAFLAIGAGIDLACAGIERVIEAIGNLVEVVSSNADGINSIVSNIGETVGGVITTISDGIATVIDAISGGVSGVLDSLAGVFESIGDAALNAGEGFEKLAGAVMDLVNNTGVLDLGATLGTVAAGVKDITKAAGDAGKAASSVKELTTSLTELTTTATTTTTTMTTFGTTATQTATNIATAFRQMNLAQSMSSAINSAVSIASSGLSRLRSMFASTRFSFNQHIAVPHFSMSGSFNAQTGSVPTIYTSWYGKAAEYGALFTTPQIIGVGDAAQPELLLGEQKLKELIGEAGTTINNYITVDGAQDPDAWVASFARSLKQYVRVTV